MKKLMIALTLLLYIVSSKAYAINYNEFIQGSKEYKNEIKCENHKCKVINQDGKVILDGYDDIQYKKEAVISEFFVKKNGKWGIINEKDEILLDFQFESLDDYEDKYIIAKKDGKLGLLEDGTYKQIFPFEFNYLKRISNGNFLISKDENIGLFDVKGEQLIPFLYDSIVLQSINIKPIQYTVSKNLKQGVVDEKGKIIVPIKYDNIDHQNCAIITKNDYKFGLYDNKGKKLYDTKYKDIVVSCEEELVELSKNGEDYIKHFFSKEAEAEFKKFQEEFNKPYVEKEPDSTPVPNAGIAIIKKTQNGYIFVDNNGKQLNDSVFDNIILNNRINKADTENGLNYLNIASKVTDSEGKFIVTKNNKQGLVDKNGKTLFEPLYDSLGGVAKNVFLAKNGEEYGMIDKNNNVIKPFKNGYAHLIPENKQNNVPENKKKTIQPKEYKVITLTKNEDTYYAEKIDDKFKILDKNGFEVDENCLYDSVEAIGTSYNNYGYLKAKTGNCYALFDENSNKILTIKAQDIIMIPDCDYFIIKENNKYFTINKKGEKIQNDSFISYQSPKHVPTAYKTILIITSENNKQGIIDKSGKIIVKSIYDNFYFDMPLILIKKDNKFGYYNLDKNTFCDAKYDGIKRTTNGNYYGPWLFFENGTKTEINR